MNQRERVLAALRNAGPTGITQVSFLGPYTVDGGPPITRLAARVGELREEGYTVVQSGHRDRCVVYVLRSAGAPVASVAPVASDASGVGVHVGSVAAPGASDATDRLFDPVVRPRGAYDDLDEAA